MEVYKSDRRYFYDFLNSGLHGAPWPKGYVLAILVYGLNDVYNYCLYCQNEAGGKHAEELLMDGLSKVLANRSWEYLSRMTMYINVSPCHWCSNKIIIFYGEARAKNYGRCMEIVFAAPYKWIRGSCVICTHKLPTPKDHNKMIMALRKLGEVYGIVVRTFARQDWEHLAKNFGIANFNYEMHPRKREDMRMEEDYEQACESVSGLKEENPKRIRAPVQAISDTMGAMTLRPRTSIQQESSGCQPRVSQPFMPSSPLTPSTTEDDDQDVGAVAAMGLPSSVLPLDVGINYRRKALEKAGVLTTHPPVEDERDVDIRRVITVDGRHGERIIYQKRWEE